MTLQRVVKALWLAVIASGGAVMAMFPPPGGIIAVSGSVTGAADPSPLVQVAGAAGSPSPNRTVRVEGPPPLTQSSAAAVPLVLPAVFVPRAFLFLLVVFVLRAG